MKKVLYFILLILSVLGFIGGIGYTVYYGGYPIAVGILALGYSAYPKVKEFYKKLIRG